MVSCKYKDQKRMMKLNCSCFLEFEVETKIKEEGGLH